jgi:hypothetical protein
MKCWFSRYAFMTLVLLSTSGVTGLPAGERADMRAAIQENGAHHLYLPLVAMQQPEEVEPALVELVLTDFKQPDGYPFESWLYGYAHSLVSQPVYAVALEIGLITFPACEAWEEEEECLEPFYWTDTIEPAFPATLPGQANPFSWYDFGGRDLTAIAHLAVVPERLKNDTDRTFSPLTILNWRSEGYTVTGRIRNDTGEDLEDVRVVVFADRCAWKEAAVSRRGLRPGQRADFRLERFYCTGEDLAVVAQGTFEP